MHLATARINTCPSMANLMNGSALQAALESPTPPLVFDCSLFPGNDGVTEAKAAYARSRLPSASYCEVGTDLSAAGEQPFPNTRPSDRVAFAVALGKLGLCSTADRIVLYGRGADINLPSDGEFAARVAAGMMWATRCWWVLWSWGFTNVAVLDGGFERWVADDRPVGSGVFTHPPRRFDAASLVDHSAAKADKATVLRLVNQKLRGQAPTVLIDTLPSTSFEGTGPTTSGRRAGHTKCAVSLPYSIFFDASTGFFLPKSTLMSIFSSIGIKAGTPVLAY
eukprot:SAG31_NODE_491_length_14923_cov_12.905221_5_plen_280_part_00